jgi:outer membrane protein OmpA-like peptidoglycan-associated protein
LKALASLCGFALVLSACGTTLPMVRGDYDLLRAALHQAKASGAMECSSVKLAEAQLAYRFASLELGQGDFDRAGQHLAAGRSAVAQAQADSADCSAEGTLPKDLGADPWADADGDGVSDRDDICPYGLEDRDGFSDGDGCSEPDNDLDGVLDADDKCPFEAEDIDGIEDEDGCPETDDDGDGVADADDACPTEAEVVNGFLDDDGCPDVVPQHITLDVEGVGFIQPLNFLGEGTELLGAGPRAVEELAALLMSSPEVRLRVIGHTSNRGDAGELQKLSLDRSQAVIDILVATGVDAQRLEAYGRGGEAPLATNRTRSGRKKNQRIELELVSGEFRGFGGQRTVN